MPSRITAIILTLLLAATSAGQEAEKKTNTKQRPDKSVAGKGQDKKKARKSGKKKKKPDKKKPDKKKPDKKKPDKKKDAEVDPYLSQLDIMNARFLRKKPHTGKPLPDASGYDGQGKPFALKQTRGSYTVLIFGCLT